MRRQVEAELTAIQAQLTAMSSPRAVRRLQPVAGGGPGPAGNEIPAISGSRPDWPVPARPARSLGQTGPGRPAFKRQSTGTGRGAWCIHSMTHYLADIHLAEELFDRAIECYRKAILHIPTVIL